MDKIIKTCKTEFDVSEEKPKMKTRLRTRKNTSSSVSSPVEALKKPKIVNIDSRKRKPSFDISVADDVEIQAEIKTPKLKKSNLKRGKDVSSSDSSTVNAKNPKLKKSQPKLRKRDSSRDSDVKNVKTSLKPAKRIKKDTDIKYDVSTKSETDAKPSVPKSIKSKIKADSPDYTNEVLSKPDTDRSSLIQLVAKLADIPLSLSREICQYFLEDVTLPFLVRYRSDKIGFKTADELRLIKDIYRNAMRIKHRASFIKKALNTKNLLTPDLEFTIDNAQSLDELEDLYSPYKTSKKSKIQEANELGLTEVAKNLLAGERIPHLSCLINNKIDSLKTEDDVKVFIKYLIGDLILKSTDVAVELPKLYESESLFVECKQSKSGKSDSSTKKYGNDNFATYYNFSKYSCYIKPHQVLAINRGVKVKELTVKYTLPMRVMNRVRDYFYDKWTSMKPVNYFREEIVKDAIKTIVLDKIEKRIISRLRNMLKMKAEKEALNVFALNLKYMLLTRPVLNQTILAIDPGYKNGCKIAVLSKDQNILDTCVSYLEKFAHNKQNLINCVKNLINKFYPTVIAIGNGIGCRDVEECISELTKNRKDVKYTIVSEQALSIYSCSKEAQEEYPFLSPNLISAVSLAKRVIDPLGELLKVKPKHLGVGMYQHDLNEKRLDEVLSDVVSEVVSEVGVNLNTAPITLLKQIAGLSTSKAEEIISFRTKNGPFQKRSQLLDVKGIGKKIFEQCAGFVRICSMDDKSSLVEPLDQTIIHPEDYESATSFITVMCQLDKRNIGRENFIAKVKEETRLIGVDKIIDFLKISQTTFDVMFQGLTRHLHYDIRAESDEIIFRSKILSFDDLRIGQLLLGRVDNVTPFGVFVDIGVNRSALIPTSSADLRYGQKVSVKILDVDAKSGKITCSLIEN